MANRRAQLLKLQLIVSCLVGFAFESMPAGGSPGGTPAPGEAYVYASAPGGQFGHPGRESVIMAYNTVHGRVECSSRTLGKNFSQTLAISLTPEGRLISARMERSLSPTGEVIEESEISRANGTVAVQMRAGGETSARSISLPGGQELSVDMSLLYLMRRFPFGTEAGWRVFMVDFSAHSVSVEVRQRGSERITVPAGTFECHRMEVTVDLLFLAPRITYWLSAELPHFLVKHEGRKGPFTTSYTTVLDSIGQEGRQRTGLGGLIR